MIPWLSQSDTHSRVELRLEGEGWHRVDPTLWATIPVLPAAAVAAESGQRLEDKVPWWRWLQWQCWGLDLVWTRWWLSFDQTSQQAWLQMLFGAQLRWLGVAVVVSGSAALLGGWLLLRLGLRPRSPLVQSLRLLARREVGPLQGESFPHLFRRAARMQLDLAPLFQAMADQ